MAATFNEVIFSKFTASIQNAKSKIFHSSPKGNIHFEFVEEKLEDINIYSLFQS